MHTVELTLHVDSVLQELLIAELADLDFDAFEQDAHSLKAYAPAARWTDAKRVCGSASRRSCRQTSEAWQIFAIPRR